MLCSKNLEVVSRIHAQKTIFGHVDPDKLTKNENESALKAINRIKDQIDGIIKERTCENISKQRIYLKDGETLSSPTVSTEALFTTLVVNSYKGRYI